MNGKSQAEFAEIEALKNEIRAVSQQIEEAKADISDKRNRAEFRQNVDKKELFELWRQLEQKGAFKQVQEEIQRRVE